jgi:hypothetical protein
VNYNNRATIAANKGIAMKNLISNENDAVQYSMVSQHFRWLHNMSEIGVNTDQNKLRWYHYKLTLTQATGEKYNTGSLRTFWQLE